MKKASIAVFTALSHPVRIRMVELLGRKERRLDELTTRLKLSASSLNHHMMVLRDSGLLITERHGKPAFHSINKELLCAALDDLRRTARLE